MANIYFKCEHCQKSLAVDESGAGRSVKCTDCKQPIQVPLPEIKWKCVSCGDGMMAPGTMGGQEIQCLQCKNTVAVPSPALKCPSCGTILQQDAVVCSSCRLDFRTGKIFPLPNIENVKPPLFKSIPFKQQGKNSDARETLPPLASPTTSQFTRTPLSMPATVSRNSTHMLFAACPRCGKGDVYAICGNCHHHDHFSGNGASSQCECGMPLAEQIICPYCQAAIFKKDFRCQPQMESSVRSQLAKDGQVIVEPSEPINSTSWKSVSTIIGCIIFGFFLWYNIGGCSDSSSNSSSSDSISHEQNEKSDAFLAGQNCAIQSKNATYPIEYNTALTVSRRIAENNGLNISEFEKGFRAGWYGN